MEEQGTSPRGPKFGGSTKRRGTAISVVTAREIVVALLSGTLVAAATVVMQTNIDDQRENEADRRENLRFVREQVAAGNTKNVTFQGIDLEGKSLAGMDLKGADFRDANLSKVDFSSTDLSGADLTKANLSGARLRNTLLIDADLPDAVLFGAYMEYVSFRDADLTQTDMRKSELLGGSFVNADFRRTDLSRAELWILDLTEANLDHPKMYGTYLMGVELSITMYAPDSQPVCINERTMIPEYYRHREDMLAVHPGPNCAEGTSSFASARTETDIDPLLHELPTPSR